MQGIEYILEVAKNHPNKNRDIRDVMMKVTEETGELATEVGVHTGYLSKSKGGVDGVLGEGCDQIIGIVDVIYLSNKTNTYKRIKKEIKAGKETGVLGKGVKAIKSIINVMLLADPDLTIDMINESIKTKTDKWKGKKRNTDPARVSTTEEPITEYTIIRVPNIQTYADSFDFNKEELPSNSILVYGSNTQGRHGKGMALIALNKYGAEYGNPKGLQGRYNKNSYAIITKDLTKSKHPSIPLTFIKEQVLEMYEIAYKQPDYKFWVPYGANDANLNAHTPEGLAGCFLPDENKAIPTNVYFKKSFADLINNYKIYTFDDLGV